MSFFVISICRYLDMPLFRYDDISKSRNTVIPKCRTSSFFPLPSSLYKYSSPFLIRTSFTYLRTSAEESSFLQMSSTLPWSATM